MTRRIRTLVIDDEPLARRGLRVRLEREDDIDIVGEAEDGPSAIAAILDCRPDLVFLDVQMPGCDGFDVVSRTAATHLPNVVFVTAYDRYALQAFAVHAMDYLLKPITHRRFQESLRRVRSEMALQDRAESADQLRAVLDLREARATHLHAAAGEVPGEPAASAPAADYTLRFTVRDGDRYILLRVSDLDWIEAAANYLRLHAGARTYQIRMTMQELERALDPRQFARVHRSAMVNLDRVSAIHPDWHGDFSIALTTGATIKLSRRYRDRLM